MKKALKCLSVIIVMLTILFSFSITALAQTTTQDGLQVNLTTDKQSYSLNEDIQITISVTNTNDFTVKGVSIEALLPDKFELKDSNDETSTKAIDLKSGEQANLTVVAVVKGEEQNATNPTENTVEQNTEPDSTTEPNTGQNNTTEPTTKPTENNADNTQNTKPNTQVTTSSISNNDNNKNNDNNNSDKSDDNTKNNSNQDNTSIKTGADYTYMGIFIVLLLASISTLLYCLIKHFNKTTKIISSILCVVIAVTSVIGISKFNAFAQENNSTITVSEHIKVDNYDYTISANVSYNIDSIDSITFKDFWESDILVDKINEIEKSYTDENGYVPKNQVLNAINDVNSYASELKDKGKIKEYYMNYCDCSNGEPVSVSIIMNSGITVVYTPRQTTLSSNTSLSPKINITSVADYQPSLYDFDKETQEFVQETHRELYDYLTPYCTLPSCYYENENVTYSSLSELRSNQLVMWVGHGVRANNHTYLEIGEEYKFSNFLKYDVFNTELKKMLDSGEIIKTSNNTIAVNYKYLDKVLGDLSNSMIYLNSCYTGCDKDLCDMFVKKGVSGLVVNSGSIIADYACAMQVGTISLLSEINAKTKNYYTISEAFNLCKKEYGEADKYGVYPFIYNGDDYRLFPVNGSIIGRVKEQGTNVPISNREVKIYNENYTSDNAMYTFIDKTKTDNNGSFKISLPAGTYTLVIDNDGENATSDYYYDTVEMKVKVDAGVDTVLLNDIVLARCENGITGYVYDNDDLINNGKNTPIADVTVDVYQNNNGTTDYIGKCKTDENGKYTFAVYKNGSYDLSFTKSGYEDKIENMVFVNGGYVTCDAYLEKSISADKGNGTKENPYRVSNIEELKAVKNDLSAYYIQIADIDLRGESWKPIGNEENPFTGDYDGNGYTISNLKYSQYNIDYEYIGLFGYNEGAINNIIINNVCLEGFSPSTINDWIPCYLGGISGYNLGEITNCEIMSGIIQTWLSYDGKVYGINSGAKIYAGGICGKNSGTIYKCVNSAKVNINSSQSAYVGGICGDNTFGKISNSFNKADVSGYCKMGDFKLRWQIDCYVAGITNSGDTKNCLCTAKNIIAKAPPSSNSQIAAIQFIDTSARFIGGSRLGENYALEEAYVFRGKTHHAYKDEIITEEYRVILTDIDTINNIWDSY